MSGAWPLMGSRRMIVLQGQEEDLRRTCWKRSELWSVEGIPTRRPYAGQHWAA